MESTRIGAATTVIRSKYEVFFILLRHASLLAPGYAWKSGVPGGGMLSEAR
jgi:hypothetical protein